MAASVECSKCGEQVSEQANSCPHCGLLFEDDKYDAHTKYEGSTGLESIVNQITVTDRLNVKAGRWKVVSWFLLVNAAIIVSLSIVSGGALIGIVPFVLLIGCTFPFISLWFSRWLAKRAHGMYIIKKESFQSEDEKSLYRLVESLSQKAGIKKTPQVGIYQSNEVNAFATGAARNRSLVAFSSGLMGSMDEGAFAAVAAHEIAHIANGDMITLALVQSVVNTIVLLCTLPLKLLELLVAFLSEQGSQFIYWFVIIARFLLTAVLMFLGSLVVKAFSRRREYKADTLAAQLLDKDSMIRALEYLQHEKPIVLRKQMAYAAFKINSPRRWLDIFSTHPSIERRIHALKNQK